MTVDQGIIELKARIEASKQITISTHRNPDGDAMGSSLALYQVLLKLGKNVKIILPDDYPDFYSWMPFAETNIIYEHEARKAVDFIQASDLLFSLDYNAFHRTTEGLSNVLESCDAFKVLVDHHREPDQFDLMFWNVNASSTCELIYKLIEDMQWKEHLDLDIAACIYTGLITDTGSFRFPSTSAYTLKIASDLVDFGLDHSSVQSRVYDNNSESRLRLMGYALSEKMVVNEAQGFAYISLSSEELQKFSFKKGDTEGLVNYPLSIGSIKVSVLITERNNQMRLSFRSKGEINVNDLARSYFNGGGHKNAAGGVSHASMKETIAALELRIPEFSTKKP